MHFKNRDSKTARHPPEQGSKAFWPVGLLFLSQEPPECRGFLFWDWVVVVFFFFFLFCNLINHLQISHTRTHAHTQS